MKNTNLPRRAFLKGTVLGAASVGAFTAAYGQTPKVGAKRINLSFRAVDLKLRYPFTISNFTRTSTPIVLTEIEYDGFIGFGEAALPPYLGESHASVLAFLQRVDLEQFHDPFELEEILAYVDSVAENNTAAKAAVDIALHDLLGKIMGTPWYKIWGLSLDRIPPTTYTIGIDTPEMVRKKTRELPGDFKVLKVKLGRSEKEDKEMIESIREVSELPIIVDANQGWKEKIESLDLIFWLKEKGVIMVEQPLSKRKDEESAWITERSPLPIFADESLQRLHDVAKLKGMFHGINVKLMKCTGMREAWKMITLARALDMKTMIGCMTETTCATAAGAHLSAAVDFIDLDGNFLIAEDLFEGVKLIDGKQTPSEAPGLGITKKA